MQIKGSKEYIPDIRFDDKLGEIWIEGESYHEYTLEVFQPVFKWIESFTSTPSKRICMNFKLYYFNTSSARIFLEIMIKLEEYKTKKQGTVVINWYYEKTDIDMLDSGEKYAEDVNIPFNFIKY